MRANTKNQTLHMNKKYLIVFLICNLLSVSIYTRPIHDEYNSPAPSIITPDLTLTINISNAIFLKNIQKDFIVNLFEIKSVATKDNSPISIRVRKLSNFLITVPNITLRATKQRGVNTTSNVNGGTKNQNGDWYFREDENYIYIQSKEMFVMPANGTVQIGFKILRNNNSPNGKSNMNITIYEGSNESNVNNNTSYLQLLSNN